MTELTSDPGTASDQLPLLVDQPGALYRFARCLTGDAFEVSEICDIGDADEATERTQQPAPVGHDVDDEDGEPVDDQPDGAGSPVGQGRWDRVGCGGLRNRAVRWRCGHVLSF